MRLLQTALSVVICWTAAWGWCLRDRCRLRHVVAKRLEAAARARLQAELDALIATMSFDETGKL